MLVLVTVTIHVHVCTVILDHTSPHASTSACAGFEETFEGSNLQMFNAIKRLKYSYFTIRMLVICAMFISYMSSQKGSLELVLSNILAL